MLYFNRVKLDEEKWKSIIEESGQKLKFINNDLERFKNKVLLDNFDENQMHVDCFKNIKIDSLLECMSITNCESFYLGSKIINDSLLAQNLEKLLKKKELNGRKWSLLYQGSRDGFKASDFHSHCDGKPNTLTIVKNTTKNIFGGYTSIPWELSKSFSSNSDNSAFIFSLVNKENKPLLFEQTISDQNSQYSVCSYEFLGPMFGFDNGNADIVIHNEMYGYSNLGNIYTNPEYPSDNDKTRKLLADTIKFAIQEIEVFQMQS